MDFLSEGKRLIKIDEKYEYHYDKIQEKTDLDISKIFYLCLLLGYLNGRKTDTFKPGRKEFRVSYLNDDQRAVFYTIANDITNSELLKHFGEAEMITKIIREYQNYSNGGMEILLENVFEPNMINGQFNDAHTNYDLDLMSYLYDQLVQVPF